MPVFYTSSIADFLTLPILRMCRNRWLPVNRNNSLHRTSSQKNHMPNQNVTKYQKLLTFKIQWKLRIASVRYNAFSHTVHLPPMILTINTTYINNIF